MPESPRAERWDADLPEHQPARAQYPARAPDQEETVVVRRKTPVPAKPRTRYPPAPRDDQLSFEDTHPVVEQ
jgi:hypothetical protein